MKRLQARPRVAVPLLALVLAFFAACATMGAGADPSSWVGRPFREVAAKAGTYQGFARVKADLAAVYFCRCADGQHDLSTPVEGEVDPQAQASAYFRSSDFKTEAFKGSGHGWCRKVAFVLYVRPDGTVQSVRDWTADKLYSGKR